MPVSRHCPLREDEDLRLEAMKHACWVVGMRRPSEASYYGDGRLSVSTRHWRLRVYPGPRWSWELYLNGDPYQPRERGEGLVVGVRALKDAMERSWWRER